MGRPQVVVNPKIPWDPSLLRRRKWQDSGILVSTNSAMRWLPRPVSACKHQVDQFERAFLAGGELARWDALDQAAKAMALKEADLEKQENQRQVQNSYFMNQYRSLTAKIERWDSFFFRQFGLSMNDWETQGFPSLLSGRQATIPTPVIPPPATGQWRIPPGMCMSPADHGAAYAANFSNLMLRQSTAPGHGVPTYLGTPSRTYSVVTDQVTPPRPAPSDGNPPDGSVAD